LPVSAWRVVVVVVVGAAVVVVGAAVVVVGAAVVVVGAAVVVVGAAVVVVGAAVVVGAVLVGAVVDRVAGGSEGTWGFGRGDPDPVESSGCEGRAFEVSGLNSGR
jgi:hypothetical protein